jgi:hypothetical protein
MANPKGLSQQSKSSVNPLETLNRPGGQDFVRSSEHISQPQYEKPRGFANPEFRDIFSAQTHKDAQERSDRIQEIHAFLKEIRREVAAIRAENQSLATEVEQIDRVALQGIPEHVGIYHLHYYEIVLQYLRNIRTKIGEARTWLMAMNSKKAKRGSAFVTRSKKGGTEYSLSQELQAARSVS